MTNSYDGSRWNRPESYWPESYKFDIMMPALYHCDVRTTLTLDDDVSAKLKAEMRKSARSFKETVNHFLRLGLMSRREENPPKAFRVRARPLGVRPGLNYDCISELLEQLEGPARR